MAMSWIKRFFAAPRKSQLEELMDCKKAVKIELEKTLGLRSKIIKMDPCSVAISAADGVAAEHRKTIEMLDYEIDRAMRFEAERQMIKLVEGLSRHK